VKFAADAGHRSGRATPSLRDAPHRQSMETSGREAIYRNRNAVQTKPATSLGTVAGVALAEALTIRHKVGRRWSGDVLGSRTEVWLTCT
jgi:hypothetical protein